MIGIRHCLYLTTTIRIVTQNDKNALPAVNVIFGEMKLSSIFSMTQEKMATLTIVNIENTNDIVTFFTPLVEVEVKGCTAIQGLGAGLTPI